jgi:hypothetical protein
MTRPDTIRHAIAKQWGYTIQGHGHTRQHFTLTLSAALDWAACYQAATITRRGQFVALKTTSNRSA